MADDVIQDPAARIEALLDKAEPQIARVFYAAVEQFRASLDLEAVAALLEQGRYEELFEQLQDVAEQLGAASNVVFVDAGRDTAEFLRTADVGRIVFDVTNWRAVQQMQENRLRLINGFTEDQRAVVRDVVTRGIATGANPIEQARQFREVVGLTRTQADAVANYRRLLERAGREEFTEAQQKESLSRALRDGNGDKSVLAAVRRRTPLKQERVDWLVERYRQRYVKYRAEVIGRTEALRSVHQGADNAYQQAQDSGKLADYTVTEYWNTAHDKRVRDSHQTLDRKPRGSDGFWHGLWGRLRYPGDPAAPARETIQCRCVITRTLRRIGMFGHNSGAFPDIV